MSTLSPFQLRQRIKIAIELIEQGSKAVGQMFSTLFFPVVPFVLHVAVVFSFAAVALYLSSAGQAEYKVAYHVENEHLTRGLQSAPAVDCKQECLNPTTGSKYHIGDVCVPAIFNRTCPACPGVTCQFTRYVKAQDASWMQWYNLFGLYWGLFFASAMAEFVLAHAFATWYWTFDKGDVPCCVLFSSITVTVVYHLGTIAFGSCILAIIRFIRAVLSYIDQKLRMYNNEVVRCLICVCQCCLWCLEKFMRFLNRNAYIMCAMKSTNFCVSAKDAFCLLMRNVVRVVVLNNVVAFLLFIGKIVIVAGIGSLSYFVFMGWIPELKVSEKKRDQTFYYSRTRL